MKIIRYLIPAALSSDNGYEKPEEFEYVEVADNRRSLAPVSAVINVNICCNEYKLKKTHYNLPSTSTIGWLVKRIMFENGIPRVIPYIIVTREGNEKIKPLLSPTTMAEIEKMLDYCEGDIDIYLSRSI